ncbi:MAG: hypothetical protein KDE17_18800 [Rhodobacteraceae bacterium]|nr:hypothetical protein [Paracoccaceae bacterium]
MGFVLTTLYEAKANGTLREEAIKMALLLDMEFNELIEELGLQWLFDA